LLPLYPQYSSTTTGSSLNEWRRLFHDDIPVHFVDPFYENELYLEAVAEKLDEALARFPDPQQADIVFSAHSVPVSVIEQGDPYQRQIEETVSESCSGADGGIAIASAIRARLAPASGFSRHCVAR